MGVPGRFPGLRLPNNRYRDREKHRDPGQNGTGIPVGHYQLGFWILKHLYQQDIKQSWQKCSFFWGCISFLGVLLCFFIFYYIFYFKFKNIKFNLLLTQAIDHKATLL